MTSLSSNQLQQYEDEGFVSPIDIFSKDKAKEIRDEIETIEKENITSVDKFHCNQIFQGYDDQIYALVHHANGKQLLQKVAKKILKLQGDGGIINLTTGQSFNLKLSAPHNVRKISEDYWIFSSGDSKIKLFFSIKKLSMRFITS